MFSGIKFTGINKSVATTDTYAIRYCSHIVKLLQLESLLSNSWNIWNLLSSALGTTEVEILQSVIRWLTISLRPLKSAVILLHGTRWYKNVTELHCWLHYFQFHTFQYVNINFCIFAYNNNNNNNNKLCAWWHNMPPPLQVDCLPVTVHIFETPLTESAWFLPTSTPFSPERNC